MPKPRLTPENIRIAVAEMYGQVARDPCGNFPFPVGRAFAESLGYPQELLDSLPPRAVGSFAGISYPLGHAALQPGETVLDLGCGAGTDSIIAARHVGTAGHVHALDLSPDMLACADENVRAAGLANVTFHLCAAEAIPLPDASVDVAPINGIFNLCPDKRAVLAELYRVLRPGGRLLVSEIVIRDDDEGASAGETCSLAGMSLTNWFQWLAGAITERSFLALIDNAGFCAPRVVRRSRNARTTRADMFVADMLAIRPHW